MRLTQEADYALRVVLYLCKLGMEEKTEAKTIASCENIPVRFLLKLLRKLVHANIVKSFRGVGGGYTIAREPQNITLKQVIEAIEGTIYVNRCLYDSAYCNLNRTNTCDVHKALEKVQRNLISELESITFRKIMEQDIE